MMIRQAIVTKYLGPTDHKGSRIKAKAYAGSVIISWDYSKNSNDNHTAAAYKLMAKLGWTGHLAGGGLPNGTGNVYVMVDSK